MPKMVCKSCELEYKIFSNDAWVIEMFNQPPRPYRITASDVWKCPDCEHIIMAGFGDTFSEHWEENFEEVLERIKSSGDIVVYAYERKS